MKKITQEYVEGIKDHNGLTVIKAPVVSEGVANWYEENKEGLEENIWKYIYYFDEHMQDIEDFPVFISNCLEKPLETLVSMQYGYYVQKDVSRCKQGQANEKKNLTYHLKNGESIKTTIEEGSLVIINDTVTGKLRDVRYKYFDDKSRRIFALDLSEVLFITLDVTE
ncbi:hypothetical protein FH002_12910 [Listeria monocytogenes]|nr:hypothetical protein [Listeria monocytogenes]